MNSEMLLSKDYSLIDEYTYGTLFLCHAIALYANLLLLALLI